MTAPLPPIELGPRDLSAYRAGNTGIDYVHRFASGRPGPHVLVNALTHGNEFCGMVAATHLLDNEVRPRIGTLTVSFANVEAYATFDPDRPFASRQLVHNLNRVWSDELLDGSQDSPELRRARALRPVVAAADHILDLHSTSEDVEPFWVYPGYARNAEVALAIGRPAVHLVMPSGLGSGTPVIQHGRHGEHGGTAGAALVAECGQHFKRASGELAVDVTLDVLAHFGLIEPRPPVRQPQRRFELLRTYVIQTPDYRFTRPVKGFETFAAGELIATDGEVEIRAPEDCTILMPAREPIVGKEGVYIARALPD
ncbi:MULTISPECIES: succinylglutamate desuccinylase/aspartoacylase domain-containing protein [Ramlibacter]|uniref:Succinylglutamate desuccinylase n=1 Tax=Ramlibacter pinisoli TaxID=2682844 RepID=A0A6N8IUZ8_9BURK|nr:MULTISPECIES: succinylglutamate desuccinylase/aspartoacylase family protein [Ramlibacter]MBA2964851.1 succinylglutamate desuccinylase/aspartoacylase family protein [Ramlibacter sp. CGMCC 1.13660]MVQ29816.1 succinylglutamate desuccinylase [Ramlibacter pinisoli]